MIYLKIYYKKIDFKYTLSITILLKIWNNAINSYDIEDAHFNAKAITVTDQRFNLNKAYEELKHRLGIWDG